MTNLLSVLLIIYSAVLIINFLVGVVLYRIHKHELTKIMIAMWGFSLINFGLQGVFLKPGLGMYLSFSTYVLVSLCLCKFSDYVLKEKRSYKFLSSIFILLLIIGGGLAVKEYYLASNYFAAFVIATPMLISSYRLWKANSLDGAKALAVFLFLNALHFLDYPVLRSYPEGAIWGFSIALVLLFVLSAFFPVYVLMQVSKEHMEELEKKVEERTSELNTTLEKNKLLVKILCHDLSNPLTVLDFYFTKMDEGMEKNIMHEKYKGRALKSLKTIFNIVSKVKDLQSITEGKRDLELRKINLKNIITETLHDFDEVLISKKVNLKFREQLNDNLYVLGDSELFKNQILTNLITNAIKFSYENSEIDIYLDDDEKFVRVTVEDYGMGIPSDILSKIFSWNERTNRAGTNGESGTGFGLPLVKTCAELMGASIRVESNTFDPNTKSGTKFIVQFDKVA